MLMAGKWGQQAFRERGAASGFLCRKAVVKWCSRRSVPGAMTKILLVEDNAAEAALVKHILESQQYVVDHVDSAEEALVRIESESYGLLILDWELPGASGDLLCKEYRSTGGMAPILFLTGRYDLSSKLTGLEYGADDYLTKPFESRELSARVRALLRRPKSLLPDVLSVPGLRLDPSRQTATIGNVQINLTKRECALLEYLMRHPNRSFSSRQLLDAVWSSRDECSEDNVRACIRLLRKKLSVDGETCLIKTSSWSGYMIENRDLEGAGQDECPAE